MGKVLSEKIAEVLITGIFSRSSLMLLMVLVILYFLSYQKYFKSSVLYNGKVAKSKKLFYIICTVAFLIVNVFILESMHIRFSDTVEESSGTYITIITTVLISFFGLTAASYTFQITDMHEQQKNFPQYGLFIEEYLGMTRFKFTIALCGTVLVSAFSVISFLVDSLCAGKFQSGYNDKLEVDMVLCSIGVEMIAWMLYLNWVIFFHESNINKYAKKTIKRQIEKEAIKKENINAKNMTIEQREAQLEGYLRRLADAELIVQRLTKNKMHVAENYPLQNRAILVFYPQSVENRSDSLWRQAVDVLKAYESMIIIRNAIVRLYNYKEKRDFLYRKQCFSENELGKVENYIRCYRGTGEEFSNMDLSGVELFQNGNLENSNFRGSNLQDMNLKGSNCKNASFSGCMLSGMHMENGAEPKRPGVRISKDTCLEGANFSDSNMDSAEICFRDKEKLFSMKNSTFDQVIFSNSRFEGIDFSFASFEDAQMFYTNWRSCHQEFPIFIHTLLSNSILEQSEFRYANFTNATLVSMLVRDCRFCESRLHHANLSNTVIEGGSWNKVMATRAAMKGMKISSGGRGMRVDFRQSVLKETDFTQSDIRNTDFTGSQINSCIFTDSKGVDSIFNNADMRDCMFNHATWEKSVFDYVQFDDTMLKNTCFMGCRLQGAKFTNCEFIYRNPQQNMKDEELKKWEKEVGIGEKTYLDDNQKTVFCSCYLENVSFKGSKGMFPNMFINSILISCDFSNTGLTEREVRMHVRSLRNCRFDKKEEPLEG